jgi:hypothetical protein
MCLIEQYLFCSLKVEAGIRDSYGKVFFYFWVQSFFLIHWQHVDIIDSPVDISEWEEKECIV